MNSSCAPAAENFSLHAGSIRGFNNGGTTWFAGDFDYSGNVDFNDLVVLAQRYNTVGPDGPDGPLLVVAHEATRTGAPRVLLDLLTDPDRDRSKRGFEAMMTMKKIDIAAIEAARRG